MIRVQYAHQQGIKFGFKSFNLDDDEEFKIEKSENFDYINSVQSIRVSDKVLEEVKEEQLQVSEYDHSRSELMLQRNQAKF